MSTIPGPDRLWFRWLAGHPLDGQYRTDATYLRKGTKLQHKTRVGRWSYLAGWQRTAIRNGLVLTPPVAAWQYMIAPTRTIVVGALTTLLAALYAAVRGWRAWQVRSAHRAYVRPLHDVLGPLLGLPPTTRAHDYITVPADFRTNEKAPVHIALPRAFAPTEANKEIVRGAVLPKLGMNTENMDVIFHSVGNPTVDFKMAPQPPDKVTWADCLSLIKACEPGQVFVGLGARNRPYIRDFRDGEVVHGGFNGQTGSGKSNMVIGWVSQFHHNEPRTLTTYIDPKQSSLPHCLVGVRGYTLANDPDDVQAMWTAIEAVETLMDRRRDQRLNDPTIEFPIALLILDELSEFADLSREYWDTIRDSKDRKTPPIWRSIARIMRMGREFGMRVLVFTQRLDSASTGGFGLRDLLGWRGLSKFKKNHWMMLIGTTPVPRAVNKVGRWIYSDGDKDRWVQNVYATEAQLRDWAMGVMSPEAVPVGADPALTCEDAPTGTGDIVGIKAMAEYAEVDYETFRKRRLRAGGIPGERVVDGAIVVSRSDLSAFISDGVRV